MIFHSELFGDIVMDEYPINTPIKTLPALLPSGDYLMLRMFEDHPSFKEADWQPNSDMGLGWFLVVPINIYAEFSLVYPDHEVIQF